MPKKKTEWQSHPDGYVHLVEVDGKGNFLRDTGKRRKNPMPKKSKLQRIADKALKDKTPVPPHKSPPRNSKGAPYPHLTGPQMVPGNSPEHSPSPWKRNGLAIEGNQGRVLVADVHDLNPNAERDADLISASPDLLAAAKAALHYYLDVVGDTEPEFIKELQVAIRKAGGK